MANWTSTGDWRFGIGNEGIPVGNNAVNAIVAFCRSIYFLALFFAVPFLSFFENPASESAIAMACYAYTPVHLCTP